MTVVEDGLIWSLERADEPAYFVRVERFVLTGCTCEIPRMDQDVPDPVRTDCLLERPSLARRGAPKRPDRRIAESRLDGFSDDLQRADGYVYVRWDPRILYT